MLSIIIPTWNEAKVIAPTIRSVQQQPGPTELLLVDAGSTDNTVPLAASLGARILASPLRQRAAQMNLGAADSTGSTLLFLHADTILPPVASEVIVEALENPTVVGGAFSRRFATRSLSLAAAGFLTKLRNRFLGWHLGDQAIFVRRPVFDQLGGFASYDRFEDLDFSRRMGRLGKLVTLRPPVLTSARRFQRLGPARQTARDFLLTLRYLTNEQAAVSLPKTAAARRPTTTHAPEQPS